MLVDVFAVSVSVSVPVSVSVSITALVRTQAPDSRLETYAGSRHSPRLSKSDSVTSQTLVTRSRRMSVASSFAAAISHGIFVSRNVRSACKR